MIAIRKIRNFPDWLWLMGSIIIIVAVGWLIGSHFMLGAVIVAGLLIGLLVFFYPETAFVASILSIVAGQMIRLPIFGGDTSILPNDIILPILLVAWLLKKLASRRWNLPRHSLTLPILAVIVMMGVSILGNYWQYDRSQLLGGAMYWLRWLEYLMVFIMALDFCRSENRINKYLSGLVWVGVILSVLGFIQLKIFPDFSSMVPKGWDPHVGRLLSTWFDPNYLGGCLALLTTITTAMALSLPWRRARWWWVATIIMGLAVVLTYSRSGYVGLVIGLGLVTMFRSRVALMLGLAAMILTILFVPRIQQRVIGIRTIDETAQLRLVSYQNAWNVISDHPWLGVGYNYYKYQQVKYGYMPDTQEHSASGSDSSILTMWVTTGLPGLIAYLWLLVAMLREAWRTWNERNLSPAKQGFGLGVFAGFLGLFIHSQFVNGLQYPHLMEIMWILLAMVITIRQPSTNRETEPKVVLGKPEKQ